MPPRGWLAAALLVAACSSSPPPPPPPKDPPQVFLIAPESSQIGTALKVKANVAGCDKVVQIQILQDKTFLFGIDKPATLPVDVELQPSVFNTLYNTRGIAVQLTLVAKAVCDDGRTNNSTPISVSFFPVESVVGPAAGNAVALPDAFIVEGGAGIIPPTFIGCTGTDTGTALARFDQQGNVVTANITLPFACSYNSSISNKNAASGTRWLLEPGVGVFSFVSTVGTALDIKAWSKANFVQIAVGDDGDAVIWNSKAMAPNLFRISKTGGANSPAIWGANAAAILNGTPVISQGIVYVPVWEGTLGQFTGTLAVQKFNYSDGTFIGENQFGLVDYGEFNTPIIPVATLSADGKLVYFAFQNASGNRTTSGVAACATNATGCSATSGAKWISDTFDAVIAATIPFNNGATIAAIAQNKTYFLDATSGIVTNVYGAPIQPTGSLVTVSVQPGNGKDFYLLNGVEGQYPTEIVAVDSPANGELWRVSIEGGQTPLTAMNIGIDDGNNVWLRVAEKQVKPLTLNQYRMVRGATLDPTMP